MSRIYRVEREWVPLKQYLPTATYAEVLDLRQSDPLYRKFPACVGNEADMNAMLRYIVQNWLKNREKIEDLDGTAKHREDLIKEYQRFHKSPEQAEGDQKS